MFSIIIPIYNEAQNIKKLVGIAQQNPSYLKIVNSCLHKGFCLRIRHVCFRSQVFTKFFCILHFYSTYFPYQKIRCHLRPFYHTICKYIAKDNWLQCKVVSYKVSYSSEVTKDLHFSFAGMMSCLNLILLLFMLLNFSSYYCALDCLYIISSKFSDIKPLKGKIS